MIGRMILGILLLGIILLCWTRVGVLATLGSALTVDVSVGLFHFRVFPGREKPVGKQKRGKKKAASDTVREQKKKKAFPKPTAADVREAVRTLSPPLKRALRRTRRGIRICPLQISLELGGRENPAASAELYGEINAGIWSVMPVMEQLLDIPKPHIHTAVNFEETQMKATGTLGVSIRIGTVLAIGAGIGLPAMRWFLRYLKKHRKQPSVPETAGAKAA